MVTVMGIQHDMTAIIDITLTLGRLHIRGYIPIVCHRHIANTGTVSVSSEKTDVVMIGGDWTGVPSDLATTNIGADPTTSRPLQTDQLRKKRKNQVLLCLASSPRTQTLFVGS